MARQQARQQAQAQPQTAVGAIKAQRAQTHNELFKGTTANAIGSQLNRNIMLGQIESFDKSTLKRVDNASVPGWTGVTLGRERRDGKSVSGADYADFMEKTRRDLTTLAGTRTGQGIANTIASSGKSVSIVDRGVDRKHGGSARATEHGSRPHIHHHAMTPGTGASSRVTHQPDRTILGSRKNDPNDVGSTSAISLGHEMIHAVHNSQGVALDKVPHHGLNHEERITVGKPLKQGQYQGRLNENHLRRDLESSYPNMAPRQRTHYGPHKVK